MNPDVTAQLVW